MTQAAIFAKIESPRRDRHYPSRRWLQGLATLYPKLLEAAQPHRTPLHRLKRFRRLAARSCKSATTSESTIAPHPGVMRQEVVVIETGTVAGVWQIPVILMRPGRGGEVVWSAEFWKVGAYRPVLGRPAQLF